MSNDPHLQPLVDFFCLRSVVDAFVRMMCAVDSWTGRWRTGPSEIQHFSFAHEVGDNCNDCHVAIPRSFFAPLCLVIEIADSIVLMFSMFLLFLLFAQLPYLALTSYSSAPRISQICIISTQCEFIVDRIMRSSNHKAARPDFEKPYVENNPNRISSLYYFQSKQWFNKMICNVDKRSGIFPGHPQSLADLILV